MASHSNVYHLKGLVDGNCRVEISNLCTFIRVFAASIISHLDTKPVQSFKN